jgi:hypothetical protein
VKPLLKSERVFTRTGDVTVWLTDDSLRIPVRMTTKMKLGKITLTLVGGVTGRKSQKIECCSIVEMSFKIPRDVNQH